MLYGWLDGETPDRYGLDQRLASLSPRQAKEKGLLMSGTFGQSGFTSSASANLQSFLESRLQARTASLGSTLFSLIWKVRNTPSGLRILALRASGRRTLGSESTSWPRPVVNDSKGSDYTYNSGNHDSVTLKLGGAAKLASWPTAAAARDWKSGDSNLHGKNSRPLNEVAMLANWPSPKASNTTGVGTRGAGGDNLQTVASWATPAAQEAGGTAEQFLERKRLNGHCGISLTSLSLQASLATWPTPMAGTPAKNGNNEAGNTDSSRKTVALVNVPHKHPFGAHTTPSPAQTEKRGQLNPEHSRWLMGYSAGWGSCGATAMQSFRKSRRSS